MNSSWIFKANLPACRGDPPGRPYPEILKNSRAIHELPLPILDTQPRIGLGGWDPLFVPAALFVIISKHDIERGEVFSATAVINPMGQDS